MAAPSPSPPDHAVPWWPAWLFSAAFHLTALVAAALVGAEVILRGGMMLRQDPAGIELELALAESDASDEVGELAEIDSTSDIVAAPVVDAARPPAEASQPADAPLPPNEDEALSVEAHDASEDVEATNAPERPSLLGLEKFAPSELTPAGRAAAALLAEPGGPRSGPLQLRRLRRPATIRVFGVEGTGAKFVYLFDQSTSMAGAPLAAAKAQLIGSLAALDSAHQFHVLFFNHDVHAWGGSDGAGRIAFATQANKSLAEDYVRGVDAAGGTERLSALYAALKLAPDVVFFLTDADDSMLASDVADVAARAARVGTSIACIEFGNGPAAKKENFLTRLASAARGQYGYVDTSRLGR